MYKIIALIALVVVIYMTMFYKTPRNKQIDNAIAEIFRTKMRHHKLIVDALENGASDTDHLALLEDKRQEVLSQMVAAEERFGIEIDKENPTEVGPVVVIKR